MSSKNGPTLSLSSSPPSSSFDQSQTNGFSEHLSIWTLWTLFIWNQFNHIWHDLQPPLSSLLSFKHIGQQQGRQGHLESNGQYRGPHRRASIGRTNWLHCDQWTRRVNKNVIITITMLLWTIYRFDVCHGKVKIHQIKVPKYIENGTVPSVMLDCEYSLDPETDRNLVVKWFFKEDPEPIYQWIVEHDLRRVPQRYQGRVNPNYRTLNHLATWQQYRALNLIRPTVEMTGRYSCHVISITSEAHDADTMIVYAKTKSIDLVTRRVSRQPSAAFKSVPVIDGEQSWSSTVSNKSEQNSITDHRSQDAKQDQWSLLTSVTEIECSVENVYPLPELTIYQVLAAEQSQSDTGHNSGHHHSSQQTGTIGHHGNHNGELTSAASGSHGHHVASPTNTQTRPRSLERARVQQNSTQLSNGAFRVSMVLSIDDQDLLTMSSDQSSIVHGTSTGKPTMFECLVAQDELKHELRKSTVFVPNLAQSWNEPDRSGGARLSTTIPLMTLLIIFCSSANVALWLMVMV